MAKTFGLDSSLRFENDNYHIETFAEPKQSKVISQVYKSGRIIEVREKPYATNIKEKTLLDLIKSTHNEQLEEVSRLLHLAENMRKGLEANAYNKMGLLFLGRGFYEEAKKTFESAIQYDPNLADGYRNLGRVFKKCGDIDRAISQLSRAIMLAPNNADYYLDLGLAYFDKGLADDALKEFEKAISINKDYAEAYFNFGLVVLKERVSSTPMPNERDVSSVKISLKYASILDRRFQERTFNEAFQHLEKKKYGEALALFMKFKETLKDIDVHEFVSDFDVFSRFSELKEIPTTIDEYIDKMHTKVEMYPEYADLRNALGKAYLIKMRALFNAAATQFMKALEINPKYEQAKKNLELVENETRGFMLFLRAIMK